MLIAFHKPCSVLSQFTSDGSPNATLAGFNLPPRVYPIGRLDADSEGLLLLSDEPGLNTQLLEPSRGHKRTYWAQVERIPTPQALRQLSEGVDIQDYRTRPAKAWILEPQPVMAERDPPIRFRKNTPTCWIGLELIEGKNRQVRRMTAQVGFPTLRLVRVRIGRYDLGDLMPGTWRPLDAAQRQDVFRAV